MASFSTELAERPRLLDNTSDVPNRDVGIFEEGLSQMGSGSLRC